MPKATPIPFARALIAALLAAAPAPGLRPDLWAIVQPVPRTFTLRVAVGY